MVALVQPVSRFEKQMDTRFEKFIIHHPFWGLFLIFIGLPLTALAVVGLCATIAALAMAFMFGWI